MRVPAGQVREAGFLQPQRSPRLVTFPLSQLEMVGEADVLSERRMLPGVVELRNQAGVRVAEVLHLRQRLHGR